MKDKTKANYDIMSTEAENLNSAFSDIISSLESMGKFLTSLSSAWMSAGFEVYADKFSGNLEKIDETARSIEKLSQNVSSALANYQEADKDIVNAAIIDGDV